MKLTKLLAIVFAALVLFVGVPATANALDTGFISTNKINYYSCTNPENAYSSSNNLDAEFDSGAQAVEYSFKINVPSDAEIKGIEVMLIARKDSESHIFARTVDATIYDDTGKYKVYNTGGLGTSPQNYTLGSPNNILDLGGIQTI